jgi:hypothetical protein
LAGEFSEAVMQKRTRRVDCSTRRALYNRYVLYLLWWIARRDVYGGRIIAEA